MPKLLHLLCSSNCYNSPESCKFDMILREALAALANVELGDEAWSQVVLIVSFGSLGICSIASLSCSTLLASSSSVHVLMYSLLLVGYDGPFEEIYDNAIIDWQEIGGVAMPSCPESFIQKSWDNQICSLQLSLQLDSLVLPT